MKFLEKIPRKELNKAEKELETIDINTRGFWEPQYQVLPYTLNYQGLSCKVCNRWRDSGHDKNCPVKKLEEKLIND